MLSTSISIQQDLTQYSASELAGLIASGDVSSSEVVEAHIQRIEQVNPKLNAVVVKRYEQARAEAKEADHRRAGGEKVGPLHGVPVTIKESLHVKDTPSTFGLTSQANTMATQDADAVARLRKSGAIILGKTNVSRLLIYYESDNPIYGRTNNPWNTDRTPGGSSGGEGAIIAAGGSPLGLGTDIGGSLRVPASFCGITSLKPTTGRVNDPGRSSVPIGQRAIVSQIGPLARSVQDLALALEVLNGVNLEPPLPLADYRQVDLSKLRVGFYSFDGTLAPAPAVQRAVQEAAQSLKQRGAQIVEWTPPDIGEAMHLFFGLFSADGGAGFKRMLGKGKRDPRANLPITLGSMPEPMRVLAKTLLKSAGQPTLGNFLEYYGHTRTDQYWTLVERQIDYQDHFRQQLDRHGIDVILCPACPLPAFTHGASNDLATAGVYSILYNVLGYPAGVVPFTRVRSSEAVGRQPSGDMVEKAALKVEQNSTGLPIGVQVVARPWREHINLAVMSALEASAREREDFPVNPPL